MMEARMVDVGEVRLHVITAAPPPGSLMREPVVLLHGFPSFWQTWRHQIGALAAAGHPVIVPDLRGYNLSEKPSPLEAYTMERVCGDIVGLILAFGHESAFVAGHDWGGIVGWHLAMRHPTRVKRLAVLNAPHPMAALRALRNPSQLLAWWYMLFFQIPWLPEQVLLRPGMIARTIKAGCANRRAFSRADLNDHETAFRQPGAATATLAWYRATFRLPSSLGASMRPIACPTLVLWGDLDPVLGEALLEDLETVACDLRVQRIAAGHWLPQEAPEEVNEALLALWRNP